MGAVRAALPMSIWIAVNGLAIYYISIAAGRPELGELAFRAVFGLFSIFAGLGGVWFFWGLADGIDFWKLGYRIRYVKPVSRSPDLSEPRTYV